MEKIAPTATSGNDTLKSPERMPEFERTSVRLCTVGLRRSEMVAQTLLDRQNSDPVWLTEVVMVQKTPESHTPNTIMFAGEESDSSSSRSPEEQEDQMIWNTLANELHAYVSISPGNDTSDISRRKYSYVHPGGSCALNPHRRHVSEHMVASEIPPFTTGGLDTFNPHKHTVPLELSPAQFLSLMQNDYLDLPDGDGKSIRNYLVDSMLTSNESEERKLASGVRLSGDEMKIKNTAMQLVLYREAMARIAVLDRVVNYLSDLGDKNKFTSRCGSMKETYDIQKNSDMEALLCFINDSDEYIHNLFAEEKTVQTVFIRAVDEEVWIKNMQAIEKSGPQKPLLLANLLSETDGVTPQQDAYIKKTPDVATICAIACDSVGVDRNDPDWWQKIRDKLVQMYAEDRAALDSQLAKQLQQHTRIEQEDLLSRMKQIIGREAYHDNAISHIAPEDVQGRIFQTHKEDAMPNLTSLFMGLFTGKTAVERRVNWRRLLDLVTRPRLEQLLIEKTRLEYGKDPFIDVRDALCDLVGEVTYNEHTFEKYALPTLFHDHVLQITVTGQEIRLELEGYQPHIFCLTRVSKATDSIARKILERGGEDGADMHDMSGMQLILDKQGFMDFLESKGHASKEALIQFVDAWDTYMAKMIISRFEKEMKARGLFATWMKVQQTGSLADVFPQGQHTPSGASGVTWTWAKAACVVTKSNDPETEGGDYQTVPADAAWVKEVQIFPDLDAQTMKAIDDVYVYAALRMLVPHLRDRFPLILLLAWYAESRNVLMHSAGRNGLLSPKRTGSGGSSPDRGTAVTIYQPATL